MCEELSVFEIEEGSRVQERMHKSLAVKPRGSRFSVTFNTPVQAPLTQRRRSTVYMDRRESRDPALSALWEGDLRSAEAAFDATRTTNSLAAVRWAEVLLMQFWLTGNAELGKQVCHRFDLAQTACQLAADLLTVKLTAAMIEHIATRPLLDRMSRRFSVSLPWTAKIGLTSKYNPGELRPSTLTEPERDVLDQWKRQQGLVAFCCLMQGIVHLLDHSYMASATSFRSAWTTCRLASDNIEAHEDIPNALGLVTCTFRLFFSVIPQSVLSMMQLEGNGDGGNEARQNLNKLIKDTDKMGETHNYAILVLAAFDIYLSTQEFRSDRMIALKSADKNLSEVLARSPNWVLFQWMQSQVLRRLGRVPEAGGLIDAVSVHIQGQLSQYSYRLTVDMACLYFVQKQWVPCINLLRRLLEDDPDFPNAGLACVLLAACSAMQFDMVSSEEYLGKLKDGSWLKKVGALTRRPHKLLLFYEICYLLNFLPWMDVDISDTIQAGGQKEASAWRSATMQEVLVLHELLNVSVIYPLENEKEVDAYEALLSVSFICGCVCMTNGNLAMAETYFQSVLKNPNVTKLEDPWHVPFTLYELAMIDIRKSRFLEANKYLNECQKKCRFKTFSFRHQLSLKLSHAREFIKKRIQGKVMLRDWNVHSDELGMVVGQTKADTLVAAAVVKREVFSESRVMEKGGTVSWSWVVESHDIGFRVHFDTVFGSEEVEELCRVETGECVEGFYTSTEEGTLVLVWDNTSSLYTDKKVWYCVK